MKSPLVEGGVVGMWRDSRTVLAATASTRRESMRVPSAAKDHDGATASAAAASTRTQSICGNIKCVA